MNKKQVLDACKNVEFFFTDFFATLVYREKEEDLIQFEWAKCISEKIFFSVSAKELYEQRKKSIQNVLSYTNTEEVDYRRVINDIYIRFHNRISDIDQEQFYELCLNTEVELESGNLILNKELYDILIALKEHGCVLGIISDYMLPSKATKKYLSDLGISELFKYIFVSSDYGVRKSSGKLYQKVLQVCDSDCCKFMIGDNKKSDYDEAIKNGFKAYYYNNPIIEKKYDASKELLKLIKMNKVNAFSNYAFLFYGFIDRLYKRLIQEGFHTVNFMSREGYYLKELFEIYQENKSEKININYVYVSRKSTLLASIYQGNKKFDYSSLFYSYKKLDLFSFLINLGFTCDEIEYILADCPYEKNKLINNFQESQEFNWIKNNESFIKKIDEKSKFANKVFKQYIIQHLDKDDNKIAFVDIGWKGTIQDNISKVLGKEYRVFGFYCGLENVTLQESFINVKEGLMFSCIPQNSKYYSALDFETYLIEQLLAAPHGSTKGYMINDRHIEPVLEYYSEADKKLYNKTFVYQKVIRDTFVKIKCIFDMSVEDSYSLEKEIMRGCLNAELLINEEMIKYEKEILNSDTNNFGNFNKNLIEKNSKGKIYRFLKELYTIHKSNLGIMGYLNYFAIKLNARKKYKWKKLVYPIVYLFLK